MIPKASTEQFLSELYQLGVRLWLEEDKLKATAPPQALSAEMASALKSRRDEIQTYLLTLAAADVITTDKQPNQATPAITAAEVENGEYPLSYSQQRLWFLEQMTPGLTAYNMPFAFYIEGSLQTQALERAIKKIFQRHAILRTRFLSRRGQGLQVVEPGAAFSLQQTRVKPTKQIIEDIQAIAAEEANRPFDLTTETLLRIKVISASDTQHYLLLTAHHIIADGWSLDVFIKELISFYQLEISSPQSTADPAHTLHQLPDLPIQYGDYAYWQQQQDNSQGLKFWQQHLAAPLPATQLTTDFPRGPVQTHSGQIHLFTLDADTSQSLKALGKSQSATLFATLFTAFNILLYRYTGQQDLLIGTAAANRDRPETEPLIGLFVNPLAVRTRIQPQLSFRALLLQVQNTLWSVQQHQQLSFEKLVEVMQPERDLSLHPFFQIKFQLDNARPQALTLPGVTIHQVPKSVTHSKLDLSLDMVETEDGLAAGFEYNTDLFKAETIARLARHFQQLLQAIVAAPDTAIAELTLLTEQEQHQQLIDWNHSSKAFNEQYLFHQRVEQQAVINPNTIALVFDDNRQPFVSLTYAELNLRANQLAHRLIALGVRPETVVAIGIERSLDMVIAMLAVLKAGGAYLPLDPTYPQERIQYMLDDASASILLTQQCQSLFDSFSDSELQRINLDQDWPGDLSTENPNLALSPQNLAYLIYTSGSTGKPKGVQIAHGGLVNLTEDKIRVCQVAPDDCVLQFFSFSFDASIPELVMSLAIGARLLLTSSDCVIPGKTLQTLMQRHRVTHITMTPSALWSLPVDDTANSGYPDLKMVLVGGEAPAPELIQRWSKGRRFINAYGPTETTVNASMVPCGNDYPLAPTLLPSTNKHLLILDDNLQLLPVGMPGELHISGVGLARGYLNRPALTAQRFIPNPYAHLVNANDSHQNCYQTLYKSGDLACYLPDGRIRILGRIDNQAKIRGYRIEIEEVEKVLHQHPDITAGVVIIREDAPGDKRLAAYGVAQSTLADTAPNTTAESVTNTATAADIQQYMRQHLPRFMVPDTFTWLEQLPLTPNGKIDTRALPIPGDMHREGGRLPQTKTEKALAQIFADILGVTTVYADDDFFTLGGHSLLATQLVAKCIETFAVEITLLELFNGPSVEMLANTIDSVLDKTATTTVVHGDTDLALRQTLQADLTLHPEIRCPEKTLTDTNLLADPKTILLTGATGFIGSYLLRELLRQTRATIYCLVRPTTERQLEPTTPHWQQLYANRERIVQAMQFYGIWEAEFEDRIIPLQGDLAKPQLGLQAETYRELAREVDVIYHNGAYVHHLLPYSQLKQSNVEGTVDILRLATTEKIKPVHFTSSLSVLPTKPLPGRTRLLETDALADYPVPQGTYNRSKWVAEQLVSEAGRRGLPITIHRPGPVSGDSESGAFNKDDILCQILQGYIALGKAPDGELPLDMLPVDYLTKLMVYLSLRSENIGKTFHHIHTEPVTSAVLFDSCRQKGLQIERVPYAEWHRELLTIAADDPQHPLYPLVALFSSRDVDDSKSSANHDKATGNNPGAEDLSLVELPFDTSQMQAARQQAPFAQPALDHTLFTCYIDALLRFSDDHSITDKTRAQHQSTPIPSTAQKHEKSAASENTEESEL